MRIARYKHLVDSFAQAIKSGRLAAGTLLPTHRELAKEHHIALATASKVYSELASMGLVTGEIGRGTFVRDQTRPPGYGPMSLQTDAECIDLAFNYPRPPTDNALLRDTLRDISSSAELHQLLLPQPTRGRARERDLVAQYLRSYQIDTTAEDIILVSGTQQGLAVAMMSILRPGDLMAVDALTYPGVISLAKHYQIELVPIPLDQQYIDLHVLAQVLKSRPIKAMYCMPTLHNPMGTVYPQDLRESLVRLARQHQVWIIEDACYAFLIEQAPPPLVALAPDCTIYVSSITKIMGGGVRFGYMVAPSKIMMRLLETLQALTWSNSTLISFLVGKWFENKTIEAMEQEKRADATAKQPLAMQALRHLSVQAHPTSFFVWIQLPENVRTDQLVQQLATHHIKVAASNAFAAGQHYPHAIRLSLGSESLETLGFALPIVQQEIEWLSLL